MKFVWPVGTTCKGAWGMMEALNSNTFTTSEGINSYLRENGAFEGYWVN